MDFLYRHRGEGKRTVKPSKDSELLEALGGEESDDSDFQVEGHSDDDSGKSDGSSDGSGGSGSDSGEEEDSADSDDSQPEEDALLQLRKNLTTEQLLANGRRLLSGRLGSGAVGSSLAARSTVCGACLSSRSDHTDEIAVCDGCGVSVHEGCYGIQESGSIASNLSDASTEPWFCEPCRASVRNPSCQVCPNTGGIYKETDAGGWIHLVCALYTPGISFFDPHRITRATLFEMSYQNWGRRACQVCAEDKFARTGICIECDAGMCKSYFHVTCAQEHGLLHEPKEDDHESYFGQCKLHSDSETIKRRKINYMTYSLQYKERCARIKSDFAIISQSAGESSIAEPPGVRRILRKLQHQQTKWRETSSAPSWKPTQKMPRSILTSSAFLKRSYNRMDLQGWNRKAMEEAEKNREILADISKRWSVNPALNVEFVAYYHDRTDRIVTMQERLASTVLSNNELTDDETVNRSEYDRLTQQIQHEKQLSKQLKENIGTYYDLLHRLNPGNSNIPNILGDSYHPDIEPLLSPGSGRGSSSSRRSTAKKSTNSEKKNAGGSKAISLPGTPKPASSLISPPVIHSPVQSMHTCRTCANNQDQHLLALCDTCKYYYHLACLNPPLSKMPKKTRAYGWQCTDCDKDPSEPFHYDKTHVDTDAPRSSRKRRNAPVIDDDSFLDSSFLSFPSFSPPLKKSSTHHLDSSEPEGSLQRRGKKRKGLDEEGEASIIIPTPEIQLKTPKVSLPRISSDVVESVLEAQSESRKSSRRSGRNSRTPDHSNALIKPDNSANSNLIKPLDIDTSLDKSSVVNTSTTSEIVTPSEDTNSSKTKGKSSKRLAAKSQEKLNTSTGDDSIVESESPMKTNLSLPEPLLKILTSDHHKDESKSTPKETESVLSNVTKSKISSMLVPPEPTSTKQNATVSDSDNKVTKSMPPKPAIKSPLIIHSTLMTESSPSFNDSKPDESPQPQAKSKISQLRSIRKLRVAKCDTNNTSTTITSTVVQSDNAITTNNTEAVNVKSVSETILVSKGSPLNSSIKDNLTKTDIIESLPKSIAKDNVTKDDLITPVLKETISTDISKVTVPKAFSKGTVSTSIANINVDELNKKIENSEENTKSALKTTPNSKEDKVSENNNTQADSSKDTIEKTTPLSKRRGLRGKKQSADPEVEIKSPDQQDQVSTEKSQTKDENKVLDNMETPKKESVSSEPKTPSGRSTRRITPGRTNRSASITPSRSKPSLESATVVASTPSRSKPSVESTPVATSTPSRSKPSLESATVATSTPARPSSSNKEESATVNQDLLRNGKVSPGLISPGGLPPKKFFKSKATLKEMPSGVTSPSHSSLPGVSPLQTQKSKDTSMPTEKSKDATLPTQKSKDNVLPTQKNDYASSEKANFQAWLGKNRSPEKDSSQVPPATNSTINKAASTTVNGASSQHSTSMSDDSVYDLDSDINMSTDSLDVTLSPVIGSSHSKKSSKGKRALQLSETDSERRERKKKRKERKRLEKMKRKQAMLSVNIVSEPDIEENGDECVIRIAPKPIKIKIKPIPPPPGQIPDEGGPGSSKPPVDDRLATSGEADDEDESVVQNMHPKKKLAHFNSGPMQNGSVDHDNFVTPEPPEFTGFSQGYLSLKSPGHSIPSLKPHHYNLASTSSYKSSQYLGSSSIKYPGSSSSSFSGGLSSMFTGGLTGPAFVDVYQATQTPLVTKHKQESSSNSMNTIDPVPSALPEERDSTVQTPSPEDEREGGVKGQDETRVPVPDLGLDNSKVTDDKSLNKDEVGKENVQRIRPRRERSSSTTKKSRDSRTKCDVCQGEGTNPTLVRCDECAKCFHFGCMNPPVKKSPKVHGWSWSCSDCAPSDVDKSWHL